MNGSACSSTRFLPRIWLSSRPITETIQLFAEQITPASRSRFLSCITVNRAILGQDRRLRTSRFRSPNSSNYPNHGRLAHHSFTTNECKRSTKFQHPSSRETPIFQNPKEGYRAIFKDWSL